MNGEAYLKCVTESVKQVIIGLHFIPVQLPAGGGVEHQRQAVQHALTHSVCPERPITHTHTHTAFTRITVNQLLHVWWRDVGVVFSSRTVVNQTLMSRSEAAKLVWQLQISMHSNIACKCCLFLCFALILSGFWASVCGHEFIFTCAAAQRGYCVTQRVKYDIASSSPSKKSRNIPSHTSWGSFQLAAAFWLISGCLLQNKDVIHATNMCLLPCDQNESIHDHILGKGQNNTFHFDNKNTDCCFQQRCLFSEHLYIAVESC